MLKRILMLGLFAGLAASSTGCCGVIRQCIANRWHANHGYGAYGGSCGACCTPAFKVPAHAAPLGCATCGIDAGAPPVMYPVLSHPPAGTPSIGSPMPLLNGGGIPSTMPPKQ